MESSKYVLFQGRSYETFLLLKQFLIQAISQPFRCTRLGLRGSSRNVLIPCKMDGLIQRYYSVEYTHPTRTYTRSHTNAHIRTSNCIAYTMLMQTVLSVPQREILWTWRSIFHSSFSFPFLSLSPFIRLLGHNLKYMVRYYCYRESIELSSYKHTMHLGLLQSDMMANQLRKKTFSL